MAKRNLHLPRVPIPKPTLAHRVRRDTDAQTDILDQLGDYDPHAEAELDAAMLADAEAQAREAEDYYNYLLAKQEQDPGGDY